MFTDSDEANESLMADPFRAEYQLLLESDPGWGRIGCLPWDEAVFGFPVAELRFAGPVAVDPGPAFAAALRDFCHNTKAELVSACASGADTAAQGALSKAGFVPVDFSLSAQIPNLKAAHLPKPRFSLRPATPGDHAAVCRIAGQAFAFGRYHGDPRFPRALANRRYEHWVHRALNGGDPDDCVFVLGQPDSVLGFMNVVIKDGNADLRLGAVDPENDLGIAGVALYAETLRAVCSMGVRSVSAKIAAANTRILNVCAMLGCRFSNPESTFHWHAPDAAHLLPAGPVSGERNLM
jgi:hypothetical protein